MVIYRLLLFRWAPLIYLVTALPTVIILAYLTPLFQVPGEDTAFLRGAAILDTGFRAALHGEAASIPANAAHVVDAFRPMQGQAGQKLDPSTIESVRTLPWTAADPAPAVRPDMTGEPPFFSLAAVVALGIGKSLDLGIVDSVLVARLVNAVVAIGIGALAISVAIHGRALLFALLNLPMTLYLAGSVAPDGVMIAALALVIGLCSRATGGGRALSIGLRVLMAVVIGVAVAIRPAYCPLLALLLTDAVRPARPRSSATGFLIAVLPLCIAVVIVALWLFREGLSVTLPPGPITPAWLKGEAENLRQHLAAVWDMLRTTIQQAGSTPLRAFVGILGWSDTPIPIGFFAAWLVALALGAVMAMFEEGRSLLVTGGIAMLLIFGFATALVFILPSSIDMAQVPDGIAARQGRHLLPLAMLLGLAIPGLIGSGSRLAYSGFGNLVSVLGWMAIFGLAAVSGWMMLPPVLLNRFYL